MKVEQLPPESKQVAILWNPTSGSRDREKLVRKTEHALRDLGYDTTAFTIPDDLFAAALQWYQEGTLRCVVAAGGDGTISLIANSLPGDIPIAVLPMGVENLLAKYLGVKKTPHRIADMIHNGKTVRLDAGRANGSLFLIMVGCGLDAEVVQQLHSHRNGHIGHLSYTKPIFRALRRYRFPKLHVEIDDEMIETPKSWAFVFNIPRYALNLKFVNHADSSDGKLDVITFRKPNIINGIGYLLRVIFRNHHGREDVFERTFKRMRISAPHSEHPVAYQIDGDPGGQLPVEIEVVPGRLRLIVSNHWLDGRVSGVR